MLKADLSRVHKHRVWTIGGAAVAVAIVTIVLAAAGSMRTPTIVQSSASKIQPAEQASLDIVPSPVIEPIPVFFVGTGALTVSSQSFWAMAYWSILGIQRCTKTTRSRLFAQDLSWSRQSRDFRPPSGSRPV